MSIGHVASWSAAGSTSLSVAPSAADDVIVLAVSTTSPPSGISVSGGGVSTWTPAASWLDTSVNCFVGLFAGTVTAPGTATVSVSGIGAGGTGLWAGQFSESTAGATWSVSAASNAPGSSGSATGSGTAITYPALSAAASGDSLYVGVCFSIFGAAASGGSSGYTYEVNGTTARQVVYSPSFSGTGGPAATQTNTGSYDAVSVILAAAASGGTGGAVTGVTAGIALLAPVGSVSSVGAVIHGAVAAVALSAPAGTARGAGATTLCQVVDSGSMATVLISPTLINDRNGFGTPPKWIRCLQVVTDPLNPGQYLLVGWLAAPPVFIAAGPHP